MRWQAAPKQTAKVINFDAAKGHRRLKSWQPSGATINSLLRTFGEGLLKRCRDAVANNPYASAAADAWETQSVGTGIIPAPLMDDKVEKERIRKEWLAWTDEADAEGVTDFYGLQSAASRAVFEAGECFARVRFRRTSDGFRVPMQIQMLEAEMLQHHYNSTGSGGNEIRSGIEFDFQGRRVAYHFLRRHPGEDQSLRLDPRQYTRVPADEVAHIYRPTRRGQIRGVPMVVPGLIRMKILDDYDDAELERKRIAALFAGFVTETGDGLIDEEGVDDDDTPLAAMEPGTMQKLRPGESVEFAEPADVGGAYEAFEYRNLLAICAGWGIPYWMVTGDLQRANYSSMRGGLIDFRRKVEAFQHNVLIFQFCRWAWKHWVKTAAVADVIKAPGGLIPVRWMPPAWPWVDPLKDLQAEKLALEMRVKSRSQVIEAQGYDPEQIDRTIAEDRQRLDKLGIPATDEPAPAPPPAVVEPPEREEEPEENAA